MSLQNEIRDREYNKFVEPSTGVTAVRVMDYAANFVWDYIKPVFTATADTYTFKVGGSGGTIVKTITLNYTDATKSVIDYVTKV